MKIINKNIEMIATFTRDGDIKPIRFRISENDELVVLKIDRVVKKEKEKICGENVFRFTCMLTVNNAERLCEIRYNTNSMIWTLWNI